MTARATERGDRVEWRLVCASFPTTGHRLHAWMMSARTTKTEQTRAELVDDRTNDPVMHTRRDCLPMRAECRYVSDWTTDTDRIQGLAE